MKYSAKTYNDLVAAAQNESNPIGQSIAIAKLKEVPEIDPFLEDIWDAFNILASERSIGFGIGYIPYSAILRYLDENGIAGEDMRDFYIRLIRSLDVQYVSKCNEEKPASKQKKPAQARKKK